MPISYTSDVQSLYAKCSHDMSFSVIYRQSPSGEAVRLLRGVRSESDQENRDDQRREAFRQKKGRRLAGF